MSNSWGNPEFPTETADNATLKFRGEVLALDADTGKTLWQFKVSSSVNSTAITYTHNGRQYVSIASGLGGAVAPRFVQANVPTGGSLWTFALLPEDEDIMGECK